jgi:hypothetical protein
MEDLDIRPKTIKLLEENVEETHQNIGLGNDFLDMTPKTQTTEAKMVKRTTANQTGSTQQRKQPRE